MVTASIEGWPTKAKEAPSPHEVRLATLDTNLVFQCFRGVVYALIDYDYWLDNLNGYGLILTFVL